MVIHVLKDGTRVDSIAGHVVKISEAEVVYNLMDEINKGRLTDETKESDRDA